MPVELTRRAPLGSTASAALLAVGGGTLLATLPAIADSAMEAPQELLRLRLRINGEERALEADARTTLLDALREELGLTGTKKGCDHGQCGACTVLVDGRRVLSCLTLAAMQQSAEITTIEGLAEGGRLHPVQAAFIKHDGFQCGYCTPGQTMSAVALLNEGRPSSDAAIREGMAGNICRCGAYPGIVAAVKEASTSLAELQEPSP